MKKIEFFKHSIDDKDIERANRLIREKQAKMRRVAVKTKKGNLIRYA